MHLMIPHASALDPHVEAALRELELPSLSRLLGLLTHEGEVGGDEQDPLAPQERALARLRGVEDDLPPIAAWAVRDAGHVPGDAAWALLTPVHLSVGTDSVTALEPASLGFDDATSQAFFEALAPLFPAAEGWRMQWLSVDAWAVAHPSLDGLAAASVSRVLNRGVETWMPRARALRTLMNEIQLLLHLHPLNQARESRGERVLNSVWISGCGRDRGHAPPVDLLVEDRLAAPLRVGDLAAWSEAWKAIDQGPVARVLRAIQQGESCQLTLCGDRVARHWVRHPASAWQKLRERLSPPHARVAQALENL